MKEDILRSKSIESFGKKTTSSIPENDPSKDHEVHLFIYCPHVNYSLISTVYLMA